MRVNFNIYKELNDLKQALNTLSFQIQKAPSRGTAETTLERSDDGPKGEVFINKIKKPHKYTPSPSIALASELDLSFGIHELSISEKRNGNRMVSRRVTC